MPVTKNALTRYALIDQLLACRTRSYSIQDITTILAQRLPEFGMEPVTKRCVEKDLNYLEYDSPFDVELEEYWIDASDSNGRPYRKRCIRYSDPTFSIFKPKLTEDEKYILSSALDTLGNFEGLENFEWLTDLRLRLKLTQKNPIISISKNILTNSELIARLYAAIKTHCVITVEYHIFGDDSKRYAAVTPHLLKEYNNRWFLIASACDTSKTLTFALDRITDFKENHIAKFRPAPENLFERYEDMIGVSAYTDDRDVETIVFWVSNTSINYIRTKPIHGSQRKISKELTLEFHTEYPMLCEGGFFKINCIINYELIRELCSFGPELIVLSPDLLRKQIKERLIQMAARYGIITRPISVNF